jgi:hypothetical protein
MPRRPFWSDTFDLDLLKVIPGVEELLGDTADVTLYTHGHIAEMDQPDACRLISPTCWNTTRGFAAFFGFREPRKPSAFWTDDPIVECTFLEALRDAWVHTYVLMVEQRTIIVMPRLALHFQRLLSHHRGWTEPLEAQVLEAHHRTVLEQLALAKSRVEYWRHMTTGPAAARVTNRMPAPIAETRP